MWKLSSKTDGLASWEGEYGSWSLDARGGVHQIRVLDDSASQNESLVAIAAAENDALPTIGEQFVRGDELHLWFPQADNSFGVRLALQPIDSNADRLVLEATISIQTSLLDTHPTLDILATGEDVRTNIDAATGTAPITSFMVGGTGAAILLGPHDSPYTTDRSAGDEVSLRLFGDFLEKGVIRKARPWFVFDRSGEISRDGLSDLLERLANSPLPLTP